MKIFVALPANATRDTFFTPENIALLESLGEVTWNNLDRRLSPEELRDALVDMDVLVGGWGLGKLTGEVLEKANKLKLVAYVCGSVATIVSDEMYDKGIRIVSGNEAFAISVAEGTLAHILASQRRFYAYDCRAIEGGWKTSATATKSLLGKTVGIVGLGAIAKYLLTMLKPFHVKVKLYSNHTTAEKAVEMGVQKADLQEIFSTCDIVSVHSAKTDANHHLVNDDLLSLMKDDALLVNTARGDIIDEDALVRHVKSGHIRASLDVYQKEPLAADHPLRELGDRINLQPHLGGPTMDYRYAAARLVLDDIARLQNGEELQNEIKPWRAQMMTH